ncbi:TetR/AcrR family transcriptional regulator [Acinetobacter sp. yr461]|jgi:AcrR family transcriptional regulator|uniref:TetR/AcrR family transcriptional regulator n=1 Tax=Acinetobacter sp. yr461 TaxID=1761742 RepID=UPI0008C7ABB6|nr:TetR/AcrR family transcriptional regulator [Acinetobacter sp. yr461]SEO17477.1 transcriptional regulator, TetR family [Acinetobacter sp. yr461]
MSKQTKEKLIEAAIILFSQNNIETLSVQRINETAGVANKSALYYHFKSKWGLVEAALDHVMQPYVIDSLELLNAIPSNNVQVSDVVDALMKPMVKILLQNNGIHYIKFFSKTISAGDEGRVIVAKTLVPISNKAVGLLQQALPDADPNAISLKVLFTFNIILNVISDVGLEHFWPTEVKDHKLLAKYLKDYIEGGIRFKADHFYS